MTEAQQLEKKIDRNARLGLWLFIGLMIALGVEVIWLAVTCYQIVHHK